MRRATLIATEMRRLVPAVLLLLPALARADEVRLKNGKVFEGVIAVERGDVIEVQIPGGSLSLPRSSVREVVHSASPYGDYLQRAEALRKRDAGAADWLALARWTRRQGLDSAAREAALAAAAQDPKLDGLGPFLRALGYEFDESGGVWVEYAEAMRRKGMVLADGRWVTRGEAAESARQREEELRQRRRERDADRLEDAAAQARLAAAELELSRARRPSENAGVVIVPSSYLWPVAVFPGYFPPAVPLPLPPSPLPEPRDPTPRPVPQAHRGTMTLDVTTRQPGSLFPGEPRPSASSSGN
jgi:hypothetical protein